MSRLHLATFDKRVCHRTWLIALFCLLLLPPGVLFGQEVTAAKDSPETPQKELIEKLSKALSNTNWTGSFTVSGDEANLKTESYEIKDAQYQGDDRWLLTARIAYGQRDLTVPIPLEIKWAGRTPVITVDNLTIPPLGTFDARVLMRRGSYAGTWAHGAKGGHLFGKYEKMEPPESTSQEEQSP